MHHLIVEQFTKRNSDYRSQGSTIEVNNGGENMSVFPAIPWIEEKVNLIKQQAITKPFKLSSKNKSKQILGNAFQKKIGSVAYSSPSNDYHEANI